MIKFEGVSFVVREVRRLGKKEFIARFKDTLWLDRTEKERKVMLADAYDICVPAEEKND